VIGALSNAAHQLATTPGARPEAWLQIMERLAPAAADVGVDVDAFLTAGQLAAWRSGLAHYRESALSVAGSLDPALLGLVLDEKGPGSAPDAFARLAALRACRWVGGQNAAANPTQPHLVRRAGAFRGFGGLFSEPPHVVMDRDQNQLYVRSGTEGWLLTADAFGATFHRATEEELAAAAAAAPPTRSQGHQLPAGIEVPADVGHVTSVACLPHTVAITGSLTHAVLLYALPLTGTQTQTQPQKQTDTRTPPPLPQPR
jgi:hypothetical protein